MSYTPPDTIPQLAQTTVQRLARWVRQELVSIGSAIDSVQTVTTSSPTVDVAYIQGWERSINLATFVSVYAAPGEKIAFSDGSDIQSNLSNGGQYSTITQAQRQKNFIIFMEACLFACGGSGAANGLGWYSSGNNAAQYATPGSVFVPGPFWIEPYDTGALGAQKDYAPNYPLWTLPALLTLWGNGRTGGGGPSNPHVTFNGWRAKTGPRIITYDSVFGWNPAGGPVPISGSRDTNLWTIDGIALARRGPSDGEVFKTTYYDSGATTHVSDSWKIKSLIVEQDSNTYGGGVPVQHGFVVRGGQDCYVDDLAVFGQDNEGYGIIHTAEPVGTAWGGLSLDVNYRKVLVQGGQKGVAFCNANCFIDKLNLESSGAQTHQLSLTSVNQFRINYFHAEACESPAWSATDAVIRIGDPAEAEVLAGVTNTSWNGCSGMIGNAFMLSSEHVSSDPGDWAAANNPAVGIQLNLGHLMLDGVQTGNGFQTSVIRAVPTSGVAANAVLDFNSRMIRSNSAARFTTTAGAVAGGYINNRNGEALATSM